MTNYGYDIVMKRVRIADLKARLSEYLRTVRRGETVTVLDRDTPVARIVPIRQAGLHVRNPASDALPLNRIAPPPSDLPLDVLELLMEERQGQR
jgi:prevent-host-death family protein